MDAVIRTTHRAGPTGLQARLQRLIHVSRERHHGTSAVIFDESSSLSRTVPLGAGDREEHLARRAISISDREEACGNALHIALETARTIKQRSADMRTSIKSSFQ